MLELLTFSQLIVSIKNRPKLGFWVKIKMGEGKPYFQPLYEKMFLI